MSRGKINYFSLWHVDPLRGEGNFRFLHLEKLLLTAAHFFLLRPKKLELPQKMSVNDALSAMSSQLGLGINVIDNSAIKSSDFPLVGRHKKTNQIILLLPNGSDSFMAIGDDKTCYGDLHIKDVKNNFDDLRLLFKKTLQNDDIKNLKTSWQNFSSTIVQRILALMKASSLVLVFFCLGQLLLSEDYNISGLFFTAIFCGAIFYVSDRLLFYGGCKLYGSSSLMAFHFLYRRLSELSSEKFSHISHSFFAALKKSIASDFHYFFIDRIASFFLGPLLMLNILFIWWHHAVLGYVLLLLIFLAFLMSKFCWRKLTEWQRAYSHAKKQQEAYLLALEASFTMLASLKSLDALIGKIARSWAELAYLAKKEVFSFIMVKSLKVLFAIFVLLLGALFLYATPENYSFSERMILFLHHLSFSFCLLYFLFIPWKKSPLASLRLKTLDDLPLPINKAHLLPSNILGRIELHHVYFKYEESSFAIIKDAQLIIEAGQCYQIKGSSGAGKSTLVKLLSAQLLPTAGQLYFDGQDVQSLDHDALHSYFGYVGQESPLFLGSVYDNIICGRSDKKKALEKLMLSHEIFDYILDLPMSLQSYVFTEQPNLSRVEKVVILLARALLHEPKILFLDEILSGINKKDQKIITDFLAQLPITRIIITHDDLAIAGIHTIYIESSELKIS